MVALYLNRATTGRGFETVRSTLFYIPAELLGVPVFGVGWVLAAWVVFSLALLSWLWSRPSGNREAMGYLPFVAIVAAVIVFLLPNLVVRNAAGQALGVPIRGFGVMLMLATVSAVGLAAYRGWQAGIDPEEIYSLAFVMFIAGIVGARLFFVVQKWDEFAVFDANDALQLAPTLRKVFNVTEGGLVVYGSVLAGLPAGIWYCLRRGLPLLVVADVIAPSMVVGQALGRIGCFLNGCCYGGVCLTSSLAVTFPAESPPYREQEVQGWHSGVWLEEKNGAIVVAYVAPNCPAKQRGLKVGDELDAINTVAVSDLAQARAALAMKTELPNKHFSYAVRKKGGEVIWWEVPQAPVRSVPVHPTQLYSAIDAGLLALVLWLAWPFRRRDGEIFALLITLHPISRILLEVIRSDEQGFWGTALTISQWLSIGILAAAGVLWWYVETNSKNQRTKEPKAEGAVT